LKGPVVSDEHPLEVLRLLLDTAAHVAGNLFRDPLLERLVKVFASMPEGDREVVIGALEREVRTRLVSQKVADSLSQVELRPNPNAQLYFRVIEPEQENPVEMMAFLRTANSLQRGIDALDPRWRELVRQALCHMDAAGLEQLNTFNRAMQEILDDVMQDGASGVEHDSPRQSPAPPAVPSPTRSRSRR